MAYVQRVGPSPYPQARPGVRQSGVSQMIQGMAAWQEMKRQQQLQQSIRDLAAEHDMTTPEGMRAFAAEVIQLDPKMAAEYMSLAAEHGRLAHSGNVLDHQRELARQPNLRGIGGGRHAVIDPATGEMINIIEGPEDPPEWRYRQGEGTIAGLNPETGEWEDVYTFPRRPSRGGGTSDDPLKDLKFYTENQDLVPGCRRRSAPSSTRTRWSSSIRARTCSSQRRSRRCGGWSGGRTGWTRRSTPAATTRPRRSGRRRLTN